MSDAVKDPTSGASTAQAGGLQQENVCAEGRPEREPAARLTPRGQGALWAAGSGQQVAGRPVSSFSSTCLLPCECIWFITVLSGDMGACDPTKIHSRGQLGSRVEEAGIQPGFHLCLDG